MIEPTFPLLRLFILFGVNLPFSSVLQKIPALPRRGLLFFLLSYAPLLSHSSWRTPLRFRVSSSCREFFSVVEWSFFTGAKSLRLLATFLRDPVTFFLALLFFYAFSRLFLIFFRRFEADSTIGLPFHFPFSWCS